MDMDLDLNMEIPEFMIHGNSREENQDDPRKKQAEGCGKSHGFHRKTI